ncbi:transcriptional regulator [uncultured Sneathiella sp.]|jgi:DNA-binding phage protein|uniref:helix-turn-helix domain-containing transcriptional regulator n=1 Tax=uncultured Sneathiella sp. TaxID=879315 RepID=UPI0030DADB2C|tara:strand:+ start:1052 stop:1369 length:318 start_codon:yes stop_codon:yes gene_type:complete
MALTRDFKDTIKQRAQNDPDFRVGLLTEAAECILNNEVDVAKTLLRDYVNATIGFQELGTLTDKKPQSLMRMLSASGNPSLGNISKLMASLRQHEGVQLHVSAGA